MSQSLILKFSGSPFPGAIACLIKTIFPPDCNLDIILSFEKEFEVEIIDSIKVNIKIKYFTNES